MAFQIVALTSKELRFAVAAAAAAFSGRTPMDPAKVVGKPFEVDGRIIQLTDTPIMRAFYAAEESVVGIEKRDAARFRACVLWPLVSRREFARFRVTDDAAGVTHVHEALVAAVAAAPVTLRMNQRALLATLRAEVERQVAALPTEAAAELAEAPTDDRRRRPLQNR